jgi:hypothetical protein
LASWPKGRWSAKSAAAVHTIAVVARIGGQRQDPPPISEIHVFRLDAQKPPFDTESGRLDPDGLSNLFANVVSRVDGPMGKSSPTHNYRCAERSKVRRDRLRRDGLPVYGALPHMLQPCETARQVHRDDGPSLKGVFVTHDLPKASVAVEDRRKSNGRGRLGA